MAINPRQTKPATASSTGVTATFTSFATATAGNLLVAAWQARTNPGTVTPPSGWLQAFTDLGALNAPTIYLWYKVAAGSETGAAVGTINSVTQDIFVWEYQGFTGTPTLDRTISANSATTTTMSTGTTLATTDANEIAVAMVGLQATGGAIVTPWTNSYIDDTSRATTAMYIATKSLSSIGTQETTLAWTTSRKAAAGIATFKDVVTATTQTSFFHFF
jgi:hypothetical protein